VLGGMTVFAAVSTIHDGGQQRTTLSLVTQATAMHLSALASARLERLALEAFAPAGPIAAAPPAPAAGQATIDLLVRRQRDGITCACRELLPVSHFFHYDAARRTLDIAAVDSQARSTGPNERILTEIARREAEADRAISNSASRIIADDRLGANGVVALVQRDDRGTALAVYGMVANMHDALSALFERSPQRSAIDSAGLTRLDSLSLEVRAVNGEVLFGTLGTGRARGVVHLGGPLRGLQLTIAITPRLVASPLLEPHSPLRLWHLGALLAATIVVLTVAATASRRELLLARARSDFIAGVSHDLRMPLAQILIASETLTLQRERNENERLSLASSIVRETRRLMALVDNVLLFSRSGAVELEPMLRAVPVGELLSETTDAVRLAVEDAGQTIRVAQSTTQMVMGDRRLVRQALVNLVDNALKYGAPGQRITLGAEQSGTTVRLTVQDEGPGIPESERDRIFEPYARLDQDQVSERTGSGLGLAVVRQIAEACKGRVWVEAAPGRGVRAVMELQAAPTMEPFAATPEIA
jgi:signal transduction histidine kinase